ncbi:MAG: polysaccharide deacetylase family protein [Flavobacteriaceae bacterium]|nr:polysaccharide deacetylase family protein [Flavobacteriaceae bacterium]
MLNFRNITGFFLALFGAVLLMEGWSMFTFIVGLCILFVGVSFTIIGSFRMKMNYFLKGIHQLPVNENREIYITFDDGPHPDFTPKILALLERYNAKATFFCIGKNIEKHPDVFLEIIQQGHLIGNHSYLHSNNYGFLSTKAVEEDIVKTQQIIARLTGCENKLFRPPFGVTNPNIARAVKKINLKTIGWSIRSYDTIAKSPEMVTEKINKKIKSGAIILLHDTSQLTVEVLEQLLISFESKSFNAKTLSLLIK